MTGLSGVRVKRWTAVGGSFPKPAGGNVFDPFRRLVEIGIIVGDQAGQRHGAFAAELPEPLKRAQQDRASSSGVAVSIREVCIISLLKIPKARRGCAGLEG